MEKFTVQEFKNYLLQRDSMGDALYFLSEANIKIANITNEEIFEDDDTDFNFSEKEFYPNNENNQ